MIRTEVVIAGSGPGGATLAYELAGKGISVVLVEKGAWHKWPLGNITSFGTITRLMLSKQKGSMFYGVTAGGSSVIFDGSAYDPPPWMKTELGIDLSAEVLETRKETGVSSFPEMFSDKWEGTKRLARAAAEMGINLVPQEKFIDFDKCDPECDDCMLGCKSGARWTARTYIEKAVSMGADLRLKTEVKRVIIENGKAKGLFVKGPNGVEEIRADKVVVAAGGFGTPKILMASGLENAGQGFFIDPMTNVMGIGREAGTRNEQTFAYASEDFIESDGFLIGTSGAFLTYMGVLGLGGIRTIKGLLKLPGYNRIMGMFTKISDDTGGRIHPDGRVDKPYSETDEKKFKKGTEVCSDILIRAGADPSSLTVVKNVGGHPGGTSAIGRVVDSDLQVYGVKDLYVCDGSVFPRSPGRPPTLTIISLAKYLSKFI